MRRTTTYLLSALNRVHRAALAPRLGELGLHPGADLALMEIGYREGLTQSELAHHLGVSRPNVTKVLRGLERDGLVRRLGDPQDGRLARVYLTERGRRTRRAAEQAWHDADRELLAHLSATDAAMLRRLLERTLGR